MYVIVYEHARTFAIITVIEKFSPIARWRQLNAQKLNTLYKLILPPRQVAKIKHTKIKRSKHFLIYGIGLSLTVIPSPLQMVSTDATIGVGRWLRVTHALLPTLPVWRS